ncbi:DUF6597 domain-containing transcriptional factor [Flavobacterium sp. ov086]|uniref:DUF6597 domain-containing transcriptional factor n=1 Tax=Flavobacterium sp. ov086 TaxID=1761785 RepID=UPI000B6D1757|nr:DUF6597 domain-containing transcriptional factor [Flavobacterium sp. ov086]SNR51193.1 hypothetical protein SAMN04487979_1092 [Flavobacterium sp. ov086]
MRSLNTLHQEFEVPEELQDMIKCFWYDKSDFGETESSFEIMPDGYAEIVFHFGNPCSISIHGDFQPLPSPFIMGLLNQPAVLRTKGYLEIIGIRCFPWTVFDLLDLPSEKNAASILKHPIPAPRSLPFTHAAQMSLTLRHLLKFNQKNENLSKSPTLKLNLI